MRYCALPGKHPQGKHLYMKNALLLALILIGQASLLSPASAENTLRVAVISDINGRYGSTDYDERVTVAVARIVALKPDLVLCTGDVVAGQRPSPKLSSQELERMWRAFHRLIRTPLEQAGIPVLMSPGNHDASAYPGFSLERQYYRNYHRQHPPRFIPMPGHNYPFHYALARDDLLFVSLDATVTGPLPKEQLQWLEELLADRDKYRAVFLFGHLPLQPIAVGRERDIIADPALESLLRSAQVEAYLSGHHHAYYPGWRDGIAMLGVGNLGGNQRRLTGTRRVTGFSFAWMDIQQGDSFSIEAYHGPEFTDVVPKASLPERVGQGAKALRRLDLARRAAK